MKPVQENAGGNHQPLEVRMVVGRDANMLCCFLSLEKAPKASKLLLPDRKKEKLFYSSRSREGEPLSGHSKERALKTTN